MGSSRLRQDISPKLRAQPRMAMDAAGPSRCWTSMVWPSCSRGVPGDLDFACGNDHYIQENHRKTGKPQKNYQYVYIYVYVYIYICIYMYIYQYIYICDIDQKISSGVSVHPCYMKTRGRTIDLWHLPSGKRLHNYGKIYHLNGKIHYLYGHFEQLCCITRGCSTYTIYINFLRLQLLATASATATAIAPAFAMIIFMIVTIIIGFCRVFFAHLQLDFQTTYLSRMNHLVVAGNDCELELWLLP